MGLSYIFVTALIVGFSGALVPGPLLTVTITETARRGFLAGPLLVLGHALLEGALIIALAAGLSAVFSNPNVSASIALLGGFFLIWMGQDMIRDAYHGKTIPEVIVGEKLRSQINPNLRESGVAKSEHIPGRRTGNFSALHPVPVGILVSLSNPYWSIWWATVGLGYITLSLRHGAAGIVSFFGGHILADLVWYSLVAGAVAGSRRFLSTVVYRGIIMVCGLFLVVLGGRFVYHGAGLVF